MTIKAIITDLDGTVVDYPNEPYRSTWDALGDSLDYSRRQKWYEVREQYSKKKNEGLEWTIAQLEILKNISEKKMIQSFIPVSYVEGVRDFFHEARKNYLTGMVTGGFFLAVELISEDLKLDFCLYNKLDLKNPENIKNIKNIYNKDLWLEEYLEKNRPDITIEENVCYIGDNVNDITMLERAALPIIIKPKNNKIKEIAYEIKRFSEINNLIKNYNSKL
jgi:phosphoserine phosphatase|tara:strand:+ start:787 stop:1446 length:660 start_codon:yes stop_codon:yes gene_type:complete